MGRNKSKDDKYFHCSEDHEIEYVSNLYDDSKKVRNFLKNKCKSGEINYSKHKKVYELIEDELSFSIPS